MTLELLAGWVTSTDGDVHQAQVKAEIGVILLMAFRSDGGLWKSVVSLYRADGSWPAPSPFSTADLAKDWAESRAEQLVQGGRP